MMREKTFILANKSYGLYYANIINYNPVTGVAKVKNCRHICKWYGRTGGITSLAAYGLCGPQADKSNIGAPCEATLTGIINVFECTDEAAQTFANVKEAAIPQD